MHAPSMTPQAQMPDITAVTRCRQPVEPLAW